MITLEEAKKLKAVACATQELQMKRYVLVRKGAFVTKTNKAIFDALHSGKEHVRVEIGPGKYRVHDQICAVLAPIYQSLGYKTGTAQSPDGYRLFTVWGW